MARHLGLKSVTQIPGRRHYAELEMHLSCDFISTLVRLGRSSLTEPNMEIQQLSAIAVFFYLSSTCLLFPVYSSMSQSAGEAASEPATPTN